MKLIESDCSCFFVGQHKDYTLIGGTAISLQIGKRLSEDLDFIDFHY
jgi:hypothetical protein